MSDDTKQGWDSLETDERFREWANWPGSVLLSDEIEYYCRHSEFKLISPFDRALLKPARYQLRLGGEARINGEYVLIDSSHPLILKPHQVAIVCTRETLNIPRFLIARWNLRVDMVYRGLLWVGALQVDPGWVGYLPCPLYNMSDKPVQVCFEEKVFTIDFVRTTPFRNSMCKRYGRNEKPEPPLSSYDKHMLRSGPYDALQKQERIENEVMDLRQHTSTYLGTLFAALGAVIAALSIVVVRPVIVPGGQLLPAWPLTALVLSAASVVLSTAALIRSGRQRKHGQ